MNKPASELQQHQIQSKCLLCQIHGLLISFCKLLAQVHTVSAISKVKLIFGYFYPKLSQPSNFINQTKFKIFQYYTNLKSID